MPPKRTQSRVQIEVGMVELGQVVCLGEVNLKGRVTAVMV